MTLADSSIVIRETSEQNIQNNSIMSNQKDGKSILHNSDSIHISIPPSTLSKTGNINVNITTDRVHFESQHKSATPTEGSYDGLAAERRSKELSMNYDDCEGYQLDFLGDDQEVFISGPLDDYPGEIILDDDDEFPLVLDYCLFSVLHDAERKLSAISAINIDGNEDLRKDRTTRRDKWLRDNRIPFEVQLDDEFYLRSGFDKGHMSRREDANWGSTAAEAKRNADLTCI